ncbi:MAG: SagB/ThcOx family dehydrogenase [Jatrophihabitantaceae bacterium]
MRGDRSGLIEDRLQQSRRAVYLRSLTGLMLIIRPAHAEILHSPSGDRWQAEILSHPVALEILRLAAGEAIEQGELVVKACQGRSALLPTASGIVDALVRAGLLVAVEVPAAASEAGQEDHDSARQWASAGWGSAFEYHRYTTGLRLLDYGSADTARIDQELMASYLASAPPPELYLDRPGELLDLPPPQPTRTATTVAELYAEDLASKPRSTDLEGLSDYCFLCFGQTGRVNFPVTGRQLLKSVPSGGSRHPTEAYLFVLDVAGVPRGTYHYSVRDHALERVDPDDPEKIALERCLVHAERLAFGPALVAVLTSRPERSMYRYREARSYRVLHLDAGHVLYNAAMVARSFGWSSYRAYSPEEHGVEPVLKVNGITEFTIGTIAVGMP